MQQPAPWQLTSAPSREVGREVDAPEGVAEAHLGLQQGRGAQVGRPPNPASGHSPAGVVPLRLSSVLARRGGL